MQKEEKLEQDMQRMFDKVWDYFAVQGNPFAFDPALDTCRYRTADGRKCAVGCLIPDEAYTKTIEESGVQRIDKWCDTFAKPAFVKWWRETMYDKRLTMLAMRLQQAHDDAGRKMYNNPNPAACMEEYTNNMRGIARDMGLSFPQEVQR